MCTWLWEKLVDSSQKYIGQSLHLGKSMKCIKLPKLLYRTERSVKPWSDQRDANTWFPFLVIFLIVLFCLCLQGWLKLLRDVLHSQDIDAFIGLVCDGTDKTMVCLELLFLRSSLLWWNWAFLPDRFTSCGRVLSKDFISPELQFTGPKTEPSQQMQERAEGSDGLQTIGPPIFKAHRL